MRILSSIIFCCLVFLVCSEVSNAQSFVEYPNHRSTFDTHELNSSWDGGPTDVTVTFTSDGETAHEDGVGSSQRTARNTQNFVAPAGAGNPQNLDDTLVVNNYGPRLPIIQQMSANGTSVLTYAFAAPLGDSIDLIITDVDNSDDVSVKAYDAGNNLLDMSQWALIAEGDLSNFKDTQNDFSDIKAPTPTTTFGVDQISLTAVDDTNYNRSYSIFRSSVDQQLSRIEITFIGQQNSPARDLPNTGSHIYVAVSTASTIP